MKNTAILNTATNQNIKTTLHAIEKGDKFKSVFICEFDGYLTLQDEAVQKKIAQMENIGFHSFSTSSYSE